MCAHVLPACRAAVLLVLGTPLFSSTFWLGGLALPLVVGGAIARYWPALRAKTQAAQLVASAAWHARGSEGAPWDAEFVGTFERQQQQQTWEERGRRSQWEQQGQRSSRARGQRRGQQQRFGGGGGGGGPGRAGVPSSDPRGYYKTLGVPPSATGSEISEAFRGLALKHHPDRYTGEADKKAATARFQDITAAYHVGFVRVFLFVL